MPSLCIWYRPSSLTLNSAMSTTSMAIALCWASCLSSAAFLSSSRLCSAISCLRSAAFLSSSRLCSAISCLRSAAFRSSPCLRSAASCIPVILFIDTTSPTICASRLRSLSSRLCSSAFLASSRLCSSAFLASSRLCSSALRLCLPSRDQFKSSSRTFKPTPPTIIDVAINSKTMMARRQRPPI